MRKVGYCAAGTFVSFSIPDDLVACTDALPANADLREPCAVLGQVVEAVRGGAAATAGAEEMRAACRIWQYCNQGRDTGDDVVVVDYVGDGKSVEFAPLAELACCGASSDCTCLRTAAEAELAMPPVPA